MVMMIDIMMIIMVIMKIMIHSRILDWIAPWALRGVRST